METAAAFGATLNATDRLRLLRTARQAVARAIGFGPDPEVDLETLGDALRSPHGAFVTLTEDGDLRGCMGTLDFAQPLWLSVESAAMMAATRDPRFYPVERDELDRIRIEVTVLEPPEPLRDVRDFDAQQLGIIVERRGRRALLLPQVAQRYGWDAERTLGAVCEKAGLPFDAWREPDACLSVFQATCFEEPRADG